MIRILIADDEPLVRDLLVATFGRAQAVEVVGVAGNALDAVELARQQRPDLALVDVRMPGGGAYATRAILECSPDTRVVALSASEDDATALAMVEAGAVSYVVKGSAPGELVEAVMRSARGERVLAASVSSGVIAGLTSRFAATRQVELERQGSVERIQHVLRERGIEPAFQPIVELATRATVGFEALSRFRSEPLRGPAEWFADAAAAGLQIELELLAVRVAIERFQRAGVDGFVSLNVSPETLPPVADLLAKVDGSRFIVEITEHAAIADYGPVHEAVAKLRDRGVRVAVDDAGAGFASLRHTLELAPDLIKLDVSIISGVDGDDRRRALTAGMLGFARELGATVVAEGIERPEELATLLELGVPLGQGYLLGRPEPVTR